MGTEARYQAIPEDCDLLKRARNERNLAEELQFFPLFHRTDHIIRANPEEHSLILEIKTLVEKHPGLAQRYFYGIARAYDSIIYLLSPIRRSDSVEKDASLIYKATYGVELLHPEARASQGMPIGFVPATQVKIIADYLNQIAEENLLEHYDLVKMGQAGVYKSPSPEFKIQRFVAIMDEFRGVQEVYQSAALHHEAMIVCID